MRKHLAVGAAAILLPMGVVAASASVAGAKKTTPAAPVDVSHATVSCSSVTGNVKFSPKVTGTGGHPLASTISLKLAGCSVSGATVSGLTGKVVGTINSADNGILSLAAPNAAVTGSLGVTWKAGKSTPITSPTSTVNVTVINGGATDGIAADSHVTFTITSGSSVTGDFQGSDSGATSTFSATSSDTIPGLLPQLNHHGISKLTFASGNLSLG